MTTPKPSPTVELSPNLNVIQKTAQLKWAMNCGTARDAVACGFNVPSPWYSTPTSYYVFDILDNGVIGYRGIITKEGGSPLDPLRHRNAPNLEFKEPVRFSMLLEFDVRISRDISHKPIRPPGPNERWRGPWLSIASLFDKGDPSFHVYAQVFVEEIDAKLYPVLRMLDETGETFSVSSQADVSFNYDEFADIAVYSAANGKTYLFLNNHPIAALEIHPKSVLQLARARTGIYADRAFSRMTLENSYMRISQIQ